ncbi:hypothetical protein [Spirochaeta dissipatitropha]
MFRIFERTTHNNTSDYADTGVYPPVLFRDEILVWGFDVIETAAGIDPDILLPVYNLEGCSWFATFRALLMHENRCDQYSFVEMDRLDKLINQYDLSEEEKSLLDPVVQRKGSFRSHVSRYRILPELLRQAVNSGLCDVRTAQAAADLPEILIQAVLERNPGFSSSRIMLTWLAEIVKRDSVDSAEAALLVDKIQSAEKPQELLKIIRYPELTARLQRAAELQDRDSGSSRLKIELPENLEGDSVNIRCQVRSKEELEEQISILSALRENLDEYLDLL